MGNLIKKATLFLLTFIFLLSSSLAPALAAISYTYDPNGNMTSDGTKCYTYNDANQLKQVKTCSNNQLIAEYVYDYQGNRLVKKEYENGTLKQTVYSPNDEYETKKIASSGATQNTTYYKVNDETLAKKNPDGSMNYFLNDHLGSNSIVTNQSGAKVEQTKYDPWGEVKSGGTKSKYLYTGQEKDLETGLNYYGARYYNSHTRRFTQPDDIIQNIYNPQSLNRYSYVLNNPLRYTDPTGHLIQIPIALYLYASALTASPDLQTDIQFLSMALSDYKQNPNEENSINVGLAIGSVAVPGVSSAGIKGASNIAKAVESGKYGEKMLSKMEPKGIPHKVWSSIQGVMGKRVSDIYRPETKTVREAKTGYQSLTKSNLIQIEKDKALVKSGKVENVIYDFFRSPITNKGGASKQYNNALEKAGFKINKWY